MRQRQLGRTRDALASFSAAAALGRPLWLLLAFNADWRWSLNRPDSPWYPTATLYRQCRLGDWTEPLGRISQELRVRFGAF
jgi:hypothetical protein